MAFPWKSFRRALFEAFLVFLVVGLVLALFVEPYYGYVDNPANTVVPSIAAIVYVAVRTLRLARRDEDQEVPQ